MTILEKEAGFAFKEISENSVYHNAVDEHSQRQRW